MCGLNRGLLNEGKEKGLCKSAIRASSSHGLRIVEDTFNVLPFFTNSHECAVNVKFHLRNNVKSVAIYKKDLRESFESKEVVAFIEKLVSDNTNIFIKTDPKYTMYFADSD